MRMIGREINFSTPWSGGRGCAASSVGVRDEAGDGGVSRL